MKMFDEGPLIALRSKGVGTLTREQAYESHAVGPTARASGIAEDRRTEHPTYQKLGFTPVVLPDGDNHARIMLRFLEILQSVDLIRTAVTTLPEGLIRGGGTMKKGRIVYAGEAPRGELTYRIKSDSFGRIQEISIQTPSIMNIEACVHFMIPGNASIADVTATYISSDPCIACTER
jgi:energy-converting hydrogenase A subunit O